MRKVFKIKRSTPRSMVEQLADHFQDVQLETNKVRYEEGDDYFDYEYFELEGDMVAGYSTGHFTDGFKAEMAPMEARMLSVRIVSEGKFLYSETGGQDTPGHHSETCLVTNLKDRESIVFAPGENWKWLGILISEDFIKAHYKVEDSVLGDLLNTDESRLFFLSIPPELDTILWQLANYLSYDVSRNLLVKAKCMELTGLVLGFLHNREREEGFGNINKDDLNMMVQIKNDLSAHIQDPPTIEEICDKFGLGKTKLFKIFRQAFGLKPHQYVMQERVNTAYRLIRGTGKTLGEIAHLTGFSDSAHLSTYFKKQYGFSPSKLRKK